MKNAAAFILLSIICVLRLPAAAQTMYYQHDTSVKVFAYGQQQTLAWCGGFNNPQFSMADLNQDGLQDLVVFEPGLGVSTFVNKGMHGNPDYRYAPEYALNFPAVNDYLILADYNCDGIPDLFQQGQWGCAVYRGYYNPLHQLCFDFYKDLFFYDSLSHSPSNVFNLAGNIPGIVDIDHDGDLDFIAYPIFGGHISLYKNRAVENGLPCDSIVMEWTDMCWGQADNKVTHFRLRNCEFDTTIHQQNALCLFDYDMDGDYDVMNGNSNYNTITFLENGRIPFNPAGQDSMISQDDTWPSSGDTVNLPSFPAAYNVDIDDDGKKDLLISPYQAQANQENYNCVLFYKNRTTPGAPDWQYESDSFLVSKAIDLGTAAYPMLFDYNKDGKPDLFVGSDGYHQPDGSLRSRLSYYMNTSTPGNPSFTLQTKDFLGMNAYNFQGAAPAAGDINNDGTADLVIGHTDGTLSYFKNMAATDRVTPNWQLAELFLTDINGDTINVGGNAAPFIYDIDKDGKPDLVIGNTSGYLQYYRNVSATPGVVQLQLINTRLGRAAVDQYTHPGYNSTPFIGKIDNSGTDYLLMGSNSGNIYQFTGFQGGDTSATYTLLDSQYAYIDSTHNFYTHMSSSAGLYLNLRSSLTVGNIAGDTTSYMIVGNAKGGLELYKRKLPASTAVANTQQEISSISVYPNPTRGRLFIDHACAGATLKIYDMLGRPVYTTLTSGSSAMADISACAPGAYLVQLTDINGNKNAAIIIKQ